MKLRSSILLLAVTMIMSACGGNSIDLAAPTPVSQVSSLVAPSELMGTWNLVYEAVEENGVMRARENHSTNPQEQLHCVIESNRVTVSSYCEDYGNHQMAPLIATSPAEFTNDTISITQQSRGTHPGCRHSLRLDQKAYSYRMPSVDQLEFLNESGEVLLRFNRIPQAP